MTKKTKNGKAQDTENKELEQEVNIENAPQAEEGAEQTQENLPEEEIIETDDNRISIWKGKSLTRCSPKHKKTRKTIRFKGL